MVLSVCHTLASMRRRNRETPIVPWPSFHCWMRYSLTTSRHGFLDRQEMKDLQWKEIALKKAAAKGSKAEQKAKKKCAEEEVRKNELIYRSFKQSRSIVPVDSKLGI